MNHCVSRVCVFMGWEWDGIGIGMAIPGGLPVWPELAIPTLKHKGLGYVGDPTSGGRP